ncbi:MAG: carotenoid 1,2-hydratase [Myxococcales bacterium]
MHRSLSPTVGTVAALSLAFTALGCAHNPYPLRKLDLTAHGSAVEEWAPHDQGSEWWYLTGRVRDAENNTYLFQHTIFHFYRGPTEAFMLHLAATDLAQKKHHFAEALKFPSAERYAKADAVAFEDNRLVVRAGAPFDLEVVGRSPALGMDLTVTSARPAVWHGADGVIVMGHKDADFQRSGYYSFTSMDVKGTLRLGDRTVEVTGDAWLDRQWGPFDEVGWEWFSLRYDDGRRAMVFVFPVTGAKFATLVDKDGNARTIGDFTDAPAALAYQNLATEIFAVKDLRFFLGWKLSLDGEEVTVKPLLTEQANDSDFLKYWEGLCSLEDAQGNSLGYAIVETTANAQKAIAQTRK